MFQVVNLLSPNQMIKPVSGYVTGHPWAFELGPQLYYAVEIYCVCIVASGAWLTH